MSRLNYTNFISDETCSIPERSNKTAISGVYEGIPETIILNLITWVLLILLFAILRNRAWDYGRLALVHSEKWTQLFYKTTNEAIPAEEQSHHDVSMIPDTGCMWFPAIFKITRDRIYTRCGPDASHYLSFQIHLLFLMLCITVFSVCVILPIHFQGTLQGDRTSFAHTTISNIPSDSKWLWVHIVAAICLVPGMIMVMRGSSGKTSNATALSSRTLMITNISKNHRNADDIRSYLTIRYPGIDIRSVHLTYKVKRLSELEMVRNKVHEARMYCVANIQRQDIEIQPYGCVVCCPCKTSSALEYYTREEERLNRLVTIERSKALENPLGIMFVTFETEEMAQHVFRSFKPGSYRNWMVFKAPSPSDINWENLEISYRNWYSKAIIINTLLFIVLFFLTTPVIVVNIFFNSMIQENVIKKISPVLSEFLPTLLLLSISAAMPVLVAYSDEWMSHWTKSKQNHATMYKTFFFLLFMVLILPSLGYTSAQAILELERQNFTMHWECIFLADKGAFFVNYVITAAFIGTALELLRFPELAMYVWRLLRIKSVAEKQSIRREILSEFPFGIHYAWTLLIFTVSTVYSLTCPLITPFGLLYLSLKHLVDKYNIYYVYKPMTMSGEGQRIHADAVKMVRVAVLLLQLITALFFFLRADLNPQTCVAFFAFACTGGFFFFVGPFPQCRPVNANNGGRGSDIHETREEQYVAPVLISSSYIEPVDEGAPQFYGGGGDADQVRVLPEIGSSEA